MKSARVQVTLLGLFLSSSLLAQHAPVAEKNPLAGNASVAEAGKKTYINSCQICHGGDGGGGRGPALATREFRHGGEDWQLFQTIRDGVPGTQMRLRHELRRALAMVTYLRTLTPAGTEEAIKETHWLASFSAKELRSATRSTAGATRWAGSSTQANGRFKRSAAT
jgi:mono/diheme cytochrome c family protein